jgi:hypothetical protein
MGKESNFRLNWIAPTLILALIFSGCSSPPAATPAPTPSSLPEPTITAPEPTLEPSPAPATATPTAAPSDVGHTHENNPADHILYHDDFTNPASGWVEKKFDNYFIGYHEPEYYHVEVSSPNYKTTVFEPEKKNFDNVTIEVKALSASSKTSEKGDFSFGPVFRRSGDQYYAFTISQRNKKWYVLKSSANEIAVLAEGTAENIHDVDVIDVLRVDAQGSNFTFSINDQIVNQISDADYASGEVGFFVQTFDATAAHVHFDELTVMHIEDSQPQAGLYSDDFTNPASGWAEEKFDNYFIGYHEPEYYHIEITSPNYKTTVFEPQKKKFDDVTIVVKAFTASSKTAESGDYSFGIAFRRSGDQYYAFTISQRSKKWFILKSTPNKLITLAEGTDEQINNADVVDVLRVDAQGSDFSFSINDKPVSQISDSDYPTGEVGFYVQTFDAAAAHIHFDQLNILPYASLQPKDHAELYHDDFTKPTSGWSEKKFDNFFIGYHEPEYYHVEISSPNYKTTVFEPEKKIFGDASMQVKAFTASSKTSESGDYRFGLVFRRSGDQYYAFVISQRTKKWAVLKSTTDELAVLAEGTDANIQNADVDDTLRVDALGPNFSFYINDELVSQITDGEYASGEVGFYVETFDAEHLHIHFDDLTINYLKSSLVCEVKVASMNLRNGPGTGYASSSFLSEGEKFQPLGRNAKGDWILVAVNGQGNQSWIFNSEGFLTCNEAIETLPVTPP